MVERGDRQLVFPELAESDKAPRSIDRIFPYYIPRSLVILNQLRGEREPNLIKVVMGVKSSKSVPSAGMATPISGQRRQGESHVASAYRIISDKSTLVPSLVSTQEAPNYVYKTDARFRYTVDDPGYPQERQVTSVVLPVLSTSLAKTSQREKFSKMFSLSVPELEATLFTGVHIYRDEEKQTVIAKVIESATIGGDLGEGRKEDNQKKDAQLESVLKFLGGVEEQIRRMTIEYLGGAPDKGTSLLEVYNQLAEDVGENEANLRVTQALDTARADIDASYFFSKEVELFSKKDRPDLISSDKERGKREARMKKSAEIVKILFNEGNFGTDILHLLPLIVKTGLHSAEATIGTSSFFKLITDLYNVSTVDRGVSMEQEIARMVLNLQNSVVHEEVFERIKEAEKKLFQNIAKLFGYEESFVSEAWEDSLLLLPYLGEAVRDYNPDIQQSTFQIHERQRKMRNLAQVLSYGLYSPDELDRFESLRQVAIFFKTLFIKEYYEKKKRGKNQPFSMAIDSFFNTPGGSFPPTFKGREFLTKMHEDLEFIVDEKAQKSLPSIVRKSMLEKPEEINDIFSISVVLFGTRKDADLKAELEEGDIRAHEERMKVMQKTTSDFIRHIRSVFKSFDLEIVDDRNGYELYRRYLRGEVTDEDLKGLSGKRVGSKGELIVRRKMVLRLTHPQTGEEHTCEFTFYPYMTIGEGFPGKGTFMGWSQKLSDDGEYMVRRMLQPLEGANGMRSLYDLLFPYTFYETTLQVKDSLANSQNS